MIFPAITPHQAAAKVYYDIAPGMNFGGGSTVVWEERHVKADGVD
jgi:hypothetical protein